MRFALDPANPGWSPGRWGGLGSAHTPGTWPLGTSRNATLAALALGAWTTGLGEASGG